ncbi:hypothetical protein HHK36_018661 [Tetracentron sinense]|uniref:Transcription repressor n=1 Tax=Tetracentron sinense TaxID=13715 RepID=A0A835DAI6_TETSI|nr:hypothetical protein HHK36_018661 [Tetracentron sinense]
MGNCRFRLSGMMPNAWFYKLKDMGRTRKHKTSHPNKKKQPTTNQPPLSNPRRSYYFSSEPINGNGFYNSPINPKASDTHFPDPPRKSSGRRSKRRNLRPSSKLVTSSISPNCSCSCSCRATLDPALNDSDSSPYFSLSPLETFPEPDLHESLLPEFWSDPIISTDSFDALASWSNSCSCRFSSSATDFIISMDNKSFTRKFDHKIDGFDRIPKLDLPPILTRPAKFNDMILDIKEKETKLRRNSAKLEHKNSHGPVSDKVIKEESSKSRKEQKTSPPTRRYSRNSTGVKLRANSPRIMSRKIQGNNRKSLSSTTSSEPRRRRSHSESFAIVKSSFDPQRDFRDSMVEMIVENNIRASKDLEELLACYLSLNSNEYHDLIVKVFEQIWFNLADIQL